MNAMLYVYRAFFSGSKLLSLYKETSSFMRLFSLYKRDTLRIANAPMFNAMALLVGCKHPVIKKHGCEHEGDDEILAKSLAVKEMTCAETVVVTQMMCSVIFRDMGKAEKLAREFLDSFEGQQVGTISYFINIYRYFYGGLIVSAWTFVCKDTVCMSSGIIYLFIRLLLLRQAFDCFRRSANRDEYWLDHGMRSIEKFEAWTSECEWNFQNKLYLLVAEEHYASGNFAEAGRAYDMAIESAKDHRFVHEEALSCELAGNFYDTMGDNERSNQLLRRAKECYESWGAHEKANALVP